MVFRLQRGFSLIETLVAFTIATVSLSIIFQIYAKGATASILAAEYVHALAIAESRLARVSGSEGLEQRYQRGREDNKYDWEVLLENYITTKPDTDAPSRYELVLVEARVSWQSQGKTRRVELQTLKPNIGD